MKQTQGIDVENCYISIDENNELIITEINDDSIKDYKLKDYIDIKNDKLIKKLKIEVVYEKKGVGN